MARNRLLTAPPYPVAQALTRVGQNLRTARIRRHYTIEEVAAKIGQGEEVVSPGVPKKYPDPKKLVTEDCIRADGPDRTFAYANPPAKPSHPDLTPEQAYADSAHHYSAKEESPPYRTKK